MTALAPWGYTRRDADHRIDRAPPIASLMTGAATASPNFAFLASRDPLLCEHGARAERYVIEDPVVALVKLRLLGELLARHAAAATGCYTAPELRRRLG